MAKVMLTGVAGFMGSHVLQEILQTTDWDVVGIASWRHKGTPERIEEVLDGHPEWRDRLEIITHDLTAPFTERTKQRIGKVDAIINVASESHVDRSIEDPVPFVMNNVALIMNMLEYAREVKPDIFLQISTDEVYGPAPEGVNFKEWATLLPSNPYSASKAAQEMLCISYWRTYSVPVVITNTMNLFGPMQDPEKYVAQLIRKVNNGEEVTVHGEPGAIGSRYYLNARNQANALVYIVRNVNPVMYTDKGGIDRPEKFHIVGEKEINNLELAEIVASYVGKPLKYKFLDTHSTRPGHDRRYALDGDKLRKLGWKAPHSFELSMQKTVEWTLKRPMWL